MITILVADAAIELIHQALQGLPKAKKLARMRGNRPSEILLDSSFLTEREMALVTCAERRGRPDIVHRVLLVALDSPVRDLLPLRLYLHTVGGRVFEVSPETRLPRNYRRFLGLMEQPLVRGRVGPLGAPLIFEVGKSMSDLTGEVEPESVVALSERGPLEDPLVAAREISSGDGFLILGGFAHGGFSGGISSTIGKWLSPCEKPVSASSALAIMLPYIYYALRGGEACQRD